MKQDDCQICTSEHNQIKIILAHLRTKILKQSHEYVPDFQEIQGNKDSSDGFSRLLALIFGHKLTTSHPNFIHCQHSKLARYFRRKLKCDNPTFFSLCSQIASKLAEKNYQIEALNTQLGSIASTAEIQAANPLAEQVLEIVRKEREVRLKRKNQISTTSILSRPEEGRGNYPGTVPNWMSQPPPPLMHFPWMFRGPHQSN